MLHEMTETTMDRDMLPMLAVLEKLVLVLRFLIVDHWVAWPDQYGVVKCINKCPDRAATTTSDSWTLSYKTFFMLNSAEHGIYPAHKYSNATIVGILTSISMINTISERFEARNFFICRYFSFYE